MAELELLPWPALAVVLKSLQYGDVRNLSLTCTKLYNAVAELTTFEAKVIFPGPFEVPLRKPLLGLRVELGDLFPQQPPTDFSEMLENLSKQPEYKVGRIKIGSGNCDRSEKTNTTSANSPEKTSQAAHFLLSHHLLSSLLAAHNRNGKSLSCLDLEVDLLCFGCKTLLKDMQVGPYNYSTDVTTPWAHWAPNTSLTVRLVNSNTMINSNTMTTGLVVHFLRTAFGLPSLRILKVFNIPSSILEELLNDWFAPDRVYFSRLRTFQIQHADNPCSLHLLLD